jgi:integrase
MAWERGVMTGPHTPATLSENLTDYLQLRRAMGFTLAREERLLPQFIAFLQAGHRVADPADPGLGPVTVADTLAWVQLPAGASSAWLGMRMTMARGFLAYLHTLDESVEVPPKGLVPRSRDRSAPYLCSGADIGALLVQARRLRTPLRIATIQTLICLLAVTGMRVGEVIALDDTDLDTATGVLIVRHAKGHKQRLIPLHPTTLIALSTYRDARDQALPERRCPALLVSTVGTRLLYPNVATTFVTLVRRAGLAPKAGSRSPSAHSLRHSFAVATLLDWYRDGGDVAARLPLLSTYLGHVDPADTYWYLHASPELLGEAAHRLEAAQSSAPTHPGGPR